MPTTAKLKLHRRRYWKIALGEDPAQWDAWQTGNFVAIGWDELGDVAQLRQREFQQRRDQLLQRFPERTKNSANLIWRFARQIKPGDRVVVTQGSQTVLGIGTVIGAYFYVPDVYKGHCFPVEWNDVRRRHVQFPQWRRPLVELTTEQFEQVINTPALDLYEVVDAVRFRVAKESPADYTSSGDATTATLAGSNPVPPTPIHRSAEELAPLYLLSACAATTGFAEAQLARWVQAIERKGQAILYGPPGTGKTFLAQELARHLVGGGDGFWSLVQFHSAYNYEDFVQGLRPQATLGGMLTFRLVAGRFLEFCARAAACTGRCVLIIDEINRANLANVFGELLYLLEYREQSVLLAGGETPFAIPANVRLIGTMNTADRSLALIDHALRRRFALLAVEPNYAALEHFHRGKTSDTLLNSLIKLLKRINLHIGDKHFALGIAFFLRTDLAAVLPDIWQMEVEPYLEEYFFSQPDEVELFRWTQVRQELGL